MSFATPAMHPILEEEPAESGSWVALSSATTLQGAAPDCVPMDTMSEASTDISSSMSELESVDSENNCKYFSVKDGLIYDLKGTIQTKKWAKRMRQKERDEKTASSSSLASSASSTSTSKAKEWLEGCNTQAAVGKAEGAKAIAAPEATGVGEVKGTMAIAVPGSKPLYVPKTGCNKAKPLVGKPHAGKRIETWPIVACAKTDCTTTKRWNFMFEDRKVLHEGSGYFGDDDYAEQIRYYCNICMALEWGITPEEAQAKIISERPGFQRKVEANKRFTEADRKNAEDLPAMSKGERRLITIAQMQEVVAPLSKNFGFEVQVVARSCRAYAGTPRVGGHVGTRQDHRRGQRNPAIDSKAGGYDR